MATTPSRFMSPGPSKSFLARAIRSALKRRFDMIVAALVIAGFAFVAAQRLGDVPLPDTDESMMLQISYEMLTRGELSFPMKRFYGGNIENAWHSLTPVYFVTLSGFMKIFGWGLAQGRAFNLITAVLLLLMVYVIARKLFGWQAGLIAIVFMVSDPVFLARSRLLRNDLIAAAFALLAFYLYERAEERKAKWFYFASGLAAGAGVMCHTNALYMPCVIAALMLFGHGLKVLKTSKPYLFAAGSLAAMSYEIIYAIVDYRNFKLQTQRDNVHFSVLEPSGWLHNLVSEPARYAEWFDARGARIAADTTLLHIFLSLTIVAIIYLIVRWSIRIRRGNTMSDPRVRALLTTAVVVLFFAVVTQRKVIQYVVHLTPWFAICVAILLRDGLEAVSKLRGARWQWAKPAYVAAMVIAATLVAVYGYELLKQNKNYLAQARNPDQADFEDFKTALRSVVPDGVCPVSIASGYLWLAFPEHDKCYFAYMEAPLDKSLDLDGKDYALIVKPKFEDRLVKLTGAGFEKYHLLGELQRTAFGSFYIYYTGNDPRFLSSEAKRYYFFGRGRGYVSEAQVKAAREVWSAKAADFTPNKATTSLAPAIEPDDPDEQQSAQARGSFMNLCSVELDPNTIYQLSADTSCRGDCELLISDDGTGAAIQRIQSDRSGRERIEGLFKTSGSKRIRLGIRVSGATPADSSPISHISIRAIAST